MLEKKFQANVRKELKTKFPGCIVTKLDSGDMQGIPDLLILYNNKWAALEVKNDSNAHHQPNQDYYINKMNEMSYAAFINPDNKEIIFDELERSFKT